MADIMLHTSSNTGFTCVSNTFIDDFMKDANGEYVKVYLYLLRCLNKDGYEFSISQLADCLDHTEKDVMRAFTYWEKVGLLRLEYSPDKELSGIYLVDVNENGFDKTESPVISNITSLHNAVNSASYAAAAPVATMAGAPAVNNINAIPNTDQDYTSDQLTSFFSDDEVNDLKFSTESYLGRPLSRTEANKIYFWHNDLHMPMDLIEYLIGSCIDNGHKSFHYMNTVAINWAEEGITSVEAAVNASSARNNTVYSVMKAFGISGRDLVQSELDYIEKWTVAYGMALDIVCEACKRTILQTNKPSFKYADSIIESWHKAAVTSMEDIAQLDQKHTAASVAKISSANRARTTTANANTAARTKANSKFHNFSQRDYNFDELEKKILGN
ncbi:DnaD and phage-associated domain-containing protein [Pseudobutyrivibrio sp. YE44]|uniref:DnaD domain protein n=1 Tax=Pseudobutyrivibrio sp. YE44 TaxID=1520802 RepID=UPI00088AABD2|nr:DnaD domain protein [Pseudobutyrivibrio sp. YE44]SDB28230.1 DnaD and phage-associated domain-containing protein [Pseudobutyrivibrio sp. YE44]